MELLLFGILVSSCMQMLNAQLVKDDPADLDTLMAGMRSLRSEMAEEKKLRGKLEDQMAEEMAEEKKLRGKLEDEMAEEKKLRGKLEDEMAAKMAEEKKLRGQLEREGNIRGQEIAALTEVAAINKDMIRTLNEQLAHKVTGEIAFFVHSETSFGPVTVDTRIPFPYENVNIGGGWKPALDTFQAPIAGYYFVTGSIVSKEYTEPRVGIVHTDISGSRTVASLAASEYNSNGDSNSAIIYMEQDDYVILQLRSHLEGVIDSNGQKYTTFSGFLLYV